MHILNRLKKLDNNTKEVFSESFKSSIVKGLGMSFGVIVSILLGRYLGPEGIGVINLTNRVVAIVLLISVFGMKQVLIKEIAIGFYNKDFKRIASNAISSYWFNGLLSISIALLFIAFSPWIANDLFNDPKLQTPLMIFLMVTPFQVLAQLFSSGLVGFRKIWQASLVEQALGLFFMVIGIGILILFDLEFSVINVAWCYSIGRLLVFLITGVYWKTIFNNYESHTNVIKNSLKVAFPLFVASLTASLSNNLDVLMLGWLSSTYQVGLYTVAAKIAFMTSFFLAVAHTAISPKIASMYEKGENIALEKMVQNTSFSLFLIGLFTLLGFIVLGKYILMLWGLEFIDGYYLLIILSIGQFFNISTGTVGSLLSMTGFEKNLLWINVFYLVFNFLLCYVLINYFGAKGAAIAMAVSVAVFNIFKVIMVKKFTGIMIISFNFLRKK